MPEFLVMAMIDGLMDYGKVFKIEMWKIFQEETDRLLKEKDREDLIIKD